MTATVPRTMDTTGWCRDCRGHSHKLCEQPDCACTLGSHPKRRHITEAPEDPLADVRARAANTEPVADVCNSCRRSQHTLCTRPDCTCGFERHPKRRVAGPKKPASATRSPAPKLAEPVWQLVLADPPCPPPKPRRNVERARPFVEELVAEANRDWHRFAIFPKPAAAGQVRTALAKAYREFEFKSVRLPETGQSALYGRWTGATPRGQL